MWLDDLIILLGVAMLVAGLYLSGCANEEAERALWQDCGNISHEECWGDPDSRGARECEYRYYLECVNGS